MSTRERLIQAGTKAFCRAGFAGTSVDHVCEQAGLTKGAFFHHFKTKQELAVACLKHWDQQTAALEARAPFQRIADPVEKLAACIDFYIGLLENPNVAKSSLPGMVAQEADEAALREAASAYFVNGRERFAALLHAAGQSRGKTLELESLAGLWMAVLEGSLVLCKASGDVGVIRGNLEQMRRYILGMLE